jgi:hypothetical protein
MSPAAKGTEGMTIAKEGRFGGMYVQILEVKEERNGMRNSTVGIVPITS